MAKQFRDRVAVLEARVAQLESEKVDMKDLHDMEMKREKEHQHWLQKVHAYYTSAWE